jgi:chemotaxis protein MotB
LSRKRQVTEENSPNVPAYIVTFSDMTTLLLTFFVMLMSLAHTQDKELYNKGRESFIRTIGNLGLGILYGRKDKPNFGNTKIKYFINNPDGLLEGRSIDAKEEDIRRTFKKVSQSMTTMRSKIVAKTTKFSVTNIHFSPGNATLNEPAKKFLTEFCLDLQQEPSTGAVSLYVLGLARDETTGKKQWILSAKRAKAVADFLNDALPFDSKWPIYSWGAGDGGDWTNSNSPISEQSQIFIAVLRTSD